MEFTYVSEDGDDKYPGKVITHVRYILIEKSLHVSFESRLADGETKSSPINLTNHSYFNLAGHANENGILDHELQIYADAWTPIDENSIPSGKV